MNTGKITDILNKLFYSEGHRVVYWNDPEQEFAGAIPDMELDGVSIVNLENESARIIRPI
ncbi:MAG: hypothetical protein ACQES5_11205 [Thermodesulfobacteriota bacterium]